MAVTVKDPQYLAALDRFSRQLRRLYRAAGEPGYRDVAADCDVSATSVHRYLNGAILPRARFVSKFITTYGGDIVQVLSTDDLYELRSRWMAVRDVLKPIEPEEDQGEAEPQLGVGGQLLRRLVSVQQDSEDEPQPQRRRRSA